jgi:hypothetical protein
MPLDTTKIDAIREQLQRVANGERVRPIDIGQLTADQFAAINAYRSENGLPALESAVVCYVGRHHYASRHAQGYTIEDMIAQLESGLGAQSEVITGHSLTGLQNKVGRNDGYGHTVKDLVTLELTQRKPKAEAFSVIPKGDGK